MTQEKYDLFLWLAGIGLLIAGIMFTMSPEFKEFIKQFRKK